ncbi:MAG: hypothetical protein ACE14P_02570 [Methanotrichaceae archaeon]
MTGYSSLLLKAILAALIVAQLPSNALNENYITVGQQPNTSLVNPLGSGYTMNSLPIISLSGVNPEIFKSSTFAKEPGGLSSGSLYTSTINNFLNGNSDAGVSNIAMRPLRLGLLVGLGQNNSI